MLVTLLIILLLSSALTSRKDKSVLYSRIVALGLLSTSCLALNNLFIEALGKGIGIYGGLFNVTSFIQIINIFTFTVSAVIIALTTFYPRKVCVHKCPNAYESLCIFYFSHNTNNDNNMGNKTTISLNVKYLFVCTWHKWRFTLNKTVLSILSGFRNGYKYGESLYITSITTMARFMLEQWFNIVNILTKLEAYIRSFLNHLRLILPCNRAKEVFLGILRVMLNLVVIMVLSVVLYLLSKHGFMDSDIYTCTDDIPSRITRCQDKIAYFTEELRGCQFNFRQSILYGDSLVERERCRVAMVETQNNLNAELRMLNLLRNAQNMGHTEVVVNSTLGKRGNSD